MFQHLPAPVSHQILHTAMAMRYCIVLEQNDTMLKQFWLFTANSRPHIILHKCAVMMTTDHCTNWHGMVERKSISAENMGA